MLTELRGFGLKLRPEYYQQILESTPPIDWFEIMSENYLNVGGAQRYHLQQISERYPLVMHGVSMSLGGTDKLNLDYLKDLKQLASDIGAVYISDHLCWGSNGGVNSHDLLPLPYNEKTLKHLVARINQVQDYLGRQILVENVSSYLSYKDSEYKEWEFIAAIAAQADCLLLLDLNNVYVSAINHDFNPLEYLDNIPHQRVAQIHLAGHSHQGNFLIDTHDAPICQEVWQLYKLVIQQHGQRPTLIERDDKLPPLEELIDELNQARKLADV